MYMSIGLLSFVGSHWHTVTDWFQQEKFEEMIGCLMGHSTPLHIKDLISILCILWHNGFICSVNAIGNLSLFFFKDRMEFTLTSKLPIRVHSGLIQAIEPHNPSSMNAYPNLVSQPLPIMLPFSKWTRSNSGGITLHYDRR